MTYANVSTVSQSRRPVDAGERWLSTASLSARLEVSGRTIDRWAKDRTRGFPAPVKFNRHRRWRESDIVAWERACATQSAA